MDKDKVLYRNTTENYIFRFWELIYINSTFMLVTIQSDATNIPLKILLTVTLVLLMIFLGIITYNKSKTDFFSSNDPDNFYYLGFIFTIASLIAGFIPFAYTDVKDLSENQNAVLSAFGLGMLTTFVGMAGRQIMLQLFDKTDVDTEDTQIRIKNSAEKFSRNMQRVTNRMDNSMNEFADNLKTTNTQITKITNKFSDQFGKIADSFTVVEERLNGSVAKFISLTEKKRS